MLLKRWLELETLETDMALVRPLVRMRGQMILETGHLTEALVTNVAAEGLVARVNAHVLPQDILRFERLLANLAHILPPGLGTQAWRF